MARETLRGLAWWPQVREYWFAADQATEPGWDGMPEGTMKRNVDATNQLYETARRIVASLGGTVASTGPSDGTPEAD